MSNKVLIAIGLVVMVFGLVEAVHEMIRSEQTYQLIKGCNHHD